MLTLGSLFDGIGGFPLAGIYNGITPIWASEIETFPIRVTKIRFPNMVHLGDITKLKGEELPSVDLITGGSPCQDLSIAGERAGLAGERSGLFMEQIRITKEMRWRDGKEGKANHLIRPRYFLWENVPGAFSSTGGEDFRAVLEETAKIADSRISIPRPPKGIWKSAGTILGDEFSIAWRVLDAQYWGVPQRRKRIFLVADFGGHTAPKILFEQESLLGNLKKIQGKTKETSSTIGKNLDDPRWNKDINIEPVICLNDQGGERMDLTENITGTLRAGMVGNLPIVLNKDSMDKVDIDKQELFENHGRDCRYNGPLTVAPTISASYGTGGNNVPLVSNKINKKDYCISANIIGRQDHNGGNGCGFQEDISYTLTTNDIHAVYNTEKGYENKLVRRLTPLECERLQGFPDGWTNIEKASDSARYKALGNSVAIPCVDFIMQGIAYFLRKEKGEGDG
jgi:DNA (cytosine-5)-methyltransferase 1